MSQPTVANHAHCRICGRAVPYGETICGTECEAKHGDEVKRRKRMVWIMWGLMGLGMVMLLSGFFSGGGT